jgi:hypothetical protein
MRLLDKQCGYLLTFVAVCMAARENVNLPHGTAVITSFIREGIVMASDGLQISEGLTGDPKNPFSQRREEAEPKIAVCNNSFLCGMAGTNPITLGKPAPVGSEASHTGSHDFRQSVRSLVGRLRNQVAISVLSAKRESRTYPALSTTAAFHHCSASDTGGKPT